MNLLFRPVSRELHAEKAFLGGTDPLEWSETIPLAFIRNELPGIERGALHFIFHSAFCCSTLLVDLLAATGRAVGMKEPEIFQNMLHRLARSSSPEERARLSVVMGLLARPFPDAQAVVVKPSCLANPLIPAIMEAVPDARAILLRSQLRPFLYSLARRGIRGRTWSRQAYGAALRYYDEPLRLGRNAVSELTDLQAAGLGWLVCQRYFDRLAKEGPNGCFFELDADDIGTAPNATLAKVADHFGLSFSEGGVADLSIEQICNIHRKDKRSFGPRERHVERRELAALHGEEVEIVAAWVEEVAAQVGAYCGSEVRQNCSAHRLSGDP